MRDRRTFLGNERGVVAIMVAIALPVLVGTAAIAVDLGYIMSIRAQLQAAADSAALAAASRLNSPAQARNLALQYATRNMPVARHGNVLALADVVLGSWNSTTRVFTPGGGTTDAIRVSARRSQTNGNAVNLFFAPILGIDTTDITASATAVRASGGNACVLALDPSARGSLQAAGSASTTFNGCNVAVNSSDSQALQVRGTAALTANCASVVGGTAVTGSATLNLTCAAAATGISPIADPYASLPSPATGACDQNNFRVNANQTATLSPGRYCNGLTLGGNSNVTLQSGTYIIDGGRLTINGGAVVQEVAGGTGITFILTNSDDGPAATVTINGGAIATLAAPTTGTYEGILFFQDERSVSSTRNSFLGGSTTNFTGALYFPGQEVRFTGGNTTGGATCTQIVANVISFTGNSVINSTCNGTGVTPISVPGTLRLVA